MYKSNKEISTLLPSSLNILPVFTTSDGTSDGTSDTRLTARLTCFLKRQKDILEPSGHHAMAPELPAAPGRLAQSLSQGIAPHACPEPPPSMNADVSYIDEGVSG